MFSLRFIRTCCGASKHATSRLASLPIGIRSFSSTNAAGSSSSVNARDAVLSDYSMVSWLFVGVSALVVNDHFELNMIDYRLTRIEDNVKELRQELRQNDRELRQETREMKQELRQLSQDLNKETIELRKDVLLTVNTGLSDLTAAQTKQMHTLHEKMGQLSNVISAQGSQSKARPAYSP